jgi:RND family efflux transporter MFP subunit
MRNNIHQIIGFPGAETAPKRTSRSSKRLLWFLLLPAMLCVLGLVTFSQRRQEKRALQDTTQAALAVPVTVMHAKPGDAIDQLVLPATLQAFDEAPLYARVSGYIHGWYADIGKHVRNNELLADIDAPEVDQQLIRARAMLSQNKSNLTLAGTTAERYRDLIKDNSVAQQEVDQNNQNLTAQQANVQAATADVAQLEQQQQYEKIVAPFDGVVTQRNVNIGDLVNAGNSGTGAQLFRVARISTMRVFVSVPEAYSQQITHGEPVQLTLTELPGETFTGQVVRTDHAIDPNTRTLLVEVDLPNSADKLMPGAYGQVHFKLQSPTHPLLVPSGTILFQAAGPQVAVVDAANRIQLRKVSIGRDLGNTVEIVSGIAPQDALVANPPDYLVNGMSVSVQGGAGKAGGQ